MHATLTASWLWCRHNIVFKKFSFQWQNSRRLATLCADTRQGWRMHCVCQRKMPNGCKLFHVQNKFVTTTSTTASLVRCHQRVLAHIFLKILKQVVTGYSC